MATKVDIGNEVKRGWELFKDNKQLLILTTLVAFLLTIVTCGILGGPMLAGAIRIVHRLLKNDPNKPQVGDLFKGFEHFVDSFLCVLAIGVAMSIVMGITRVVGSAVSLVGGALMSICLMYIVFGKLKFVDAMKKLFEEISTGPFWTLVLAMVVANLIGGVGVLACGVGVFFTMPIGLCIVVCAYLTVYGDGALTLAAPAAPAAAPEATPPPATPAPQA